MLYYDYNNKSVTKPGGRRMSSLVVVVLKESMIRKSAPG